MFYQEYDSMILRASIKDPLEDKQMDCVYLAQFVWFLWRQSYSIDVKERGRKTISIQSTPIREEETCVTVLWVKTKNIPQTSEKNCLSKY